MRIRKLNYNKTRILQFFTKFIGIIALMLIVFSQSAFAQGPPPPPSAPVGIVPWGNPFIYLSILLGYSYFKMKKLNQK